MPTSSAPGKVYLFGEHAVVYGEPAVPCAIDRRARVTVEPREDGQLRVDAPALTFTEATVTYDDEGGSTVSVPSAVARHEIRYVRAAIDSVRSNAGEPDLGFDVRVGSDLPIGAGLGSSAAVTVATLDAASRAVGEELDRRDLADRCYRIEHEVQGGASRADTFCATMGGAVRIEGDDCRTIEAPDLPIVIGYDGGTGDTGELVAGVRSLHERYAVITETIAAIGSLARTGEAMLADARVDGLGQLMDINHGLLSAIGVSSRSLDAMVWAAREAGALGAKLTGAGGGGCVVALDPTDAAVTALELASECELAFPAPMSREGLVRER